MTIRKRKQEHDPIQSCIKKYKIFRNNLTKEVKDLHSENYNDTDEIN